MDQPAALPYDQQPVNRDVDHIPGRDGLPLIGLTLTMFRDPYKLFGEQYARFGPVSRLHITGMRGVVLADPDLAQRVLLDREKNFSSKMGWMAMMADYFKGSLVLRDYEEHRFHRGIMQTAFRTDSMDGYSARVQQIVAKNAQRWLQKKEVLFYDEVKQLLLDIAVEVFAGVDESPEARAKLNTAFLQMMAGTNGIVRKDWPGFLYHRGLEGRRYLERYLYGMIEKKRASDDEDAFAFFCRERNEQGEYFSDEDIVDHMVFLLLAAHDTTSSAITMAGYYLAHHPELQEDLAADIAPNARPFTYDALFRTMKKVESTFYEAIRLHPPVNMLIRRTIRDCQLGDYHVPARTMICVPVLQIQRLPQWWKDPDEFQPDRFYPERAEQRQHPFLWMPFGGGAHRCIGMHFARMLFMATYGEILSTHRFAFTKPDYFPAKIQHFPFSKPADNLPLTFRAAT